MLLISLLVTISSFSQNTYPKITSDSLIVITPLQLKQANLIFVEHKSLKLENSLLNEQVIDYSVLTNHLLIADSLNKRKVNYYEKELEETNYTIYELENIIRKQHKTLQNNKTAIEGLLIGLISTIIICVIK